MSQPRSIAIAGIHTGIGKTIVSALLCEAWGADYWKPVQAGSLEYSDSRQVRELLTEPANRVHPEAVQLELAASPHKAAAAEHNLFDFRDFVFPQTPNLLITETAGGLLSPIDQQYTMADFIGHFNLPLLLVTRNDLGSINHTLLCLELIRQYGLNLLALVVNGPRDTASEDFIRSRSGDLPFIYSPELDTLDAIHAATAARLLRPQLDLALPDYVTS